MGLALTNPRERGRINAGARAIAKHGATLDEVVTMLTNHASAKDIKEKFKFYDPPGKGTGLIGDSPKKRRMGGGINSTQTEAEKIASRQVLANAKRDIAMALEKAGYGKTLVRYLPGPKGGPAKRVEIGYADRVLGGKARRYFLKAKKSGNVVAARASKRGKKSFPGYQRINVPVVERWNAKNLQRRKDTVDGYAAALAANDRAAIARMKFTESHNAKWQGIKDGWKNAPAKTATGRTAGRSEYEAALAHLQDAGGLSRKEAVQAIKGAKAAGMSHMDAANQFLGSMRAASNPGVFDGLALTNPMMDYKGLAIKGGVALAAAGAGVYVHSKVVPVVSEYYEKIPVVGEYLVEYDYAATGLLAGIALGGVAAYIGGDAGMYIGLLAGGVAAAGGALQVAEMVGIFDGGGDAELIEDEELEATDADMAGVFGGIALDNQGVFGGIALDNEGVFGGIALDNYGDGMAYELGGFSSPFDEAASAYGSAELADAQHAGADLDVAEGEAACAGPQQWMNRFGHPPHRVSAMGGSNGSASHLAGRRGHRWGWLIKMIGFKKFQRLAALPPQKRLAVIKKMRLAAIQTMKHEMQAALPPMDPEFVSGHTAGAAPTLAGADTSYGGMLFAGESAM